MLEYAVGLDSGCVKGGALTALVFDCYLILPLRFTFNPTLVPRVRLVDSWATGLLYMKALSFGLRAGPRNSLSRRINQVRRQRGW